MAHPLIDALTTAGDSSARVAGNLARDGYTARYENGCPDDNLADAYLADALMGDHFGASTQNDNHTINDRHASRAARQNAQQRREWRVEISYALSGMTPELRRDTYDAIARKGGAAFAIRLQDAVDHLGTDFLAAIRSAALDLPATLDRAA
jgi:hypothetical protein